MTPLLFALAILICELLLGFIFSAIAQVFYQKNGINFRSLLKGVIERGFLFVALANDYPHALTLFGALKVATRLKHTSASPAEENAFNNFYLIGNFVSVAVVIGYMYAYKLFFGAR